MTAPLDVKVSVFRGSTKTTPTSTCPLGAMLHRIQSGTYEKSVTHLRKLLATKGKAPYDEAKRQSMAFTPAGVFTKRANTKLITPSGMVHFDFDHPPELAEAKALLIADPWIAYVFVSPSGDGLKAAVWAEGIVDDRTYKHAWGTVLAYFERTYPDLAVSNDKACKDIARLCYVSHDPDLYMNPDALLYAVPPYQAPAPTPTPPPRQTGEPLPTDRRERYARHALDTAAQMIYAGMASTPTSPGTRHETQLRAAVLLGGYVAGGVLSSSEAYAALEAAVTSNTDDLRGDMVTIRDGLRYGEAHPITIDQLEAERLDWLEAHRARLDGHGRPAVPDMSGPPLGTQEAPTPDEDRPQQAGPDTAPARPRLLIDMDTVERKSVDWLWEPYLALGKLCMLDGDPGVGKTMLALQLAANVSQGFPFPDQHGKPTLTPCPPAPTLFIAMEDDLADTVKPRLEDAGADCRYIKVLNEAEDDQGRPRPVTLEHIPYIARMIEEVKPRLVVIDSIQSVLGGKVDIHRANQVTEKLALLEDLARRSRCALVCIRHPSKPGQGIAKLIHRGMGSVAFIGRARLGMFVEEHPTDPTLVLLVQAKSNAGTPACTQIFSKRDGRFSWAGVTRLTSKDLAGSGHGPDPSAMLSAYLWLETRLAGNLAWSAADIQLEADEADLSKKVLLSASKRLNVLKKQTPEGWTWRLPPLPPLSTTGYTGYTGTTGVTGSTGGSDSVSGEERHPTPDTPYDPDDPEHPEHPVDPIVTEGWERKEGRKDGASATREEFKV